MKRRNFIKKTSTTSAATFLAPTILPSGIFGKTTANKKINIGQIGCGRIAREHDMPGVMQYDNARLIAVCDVDSNRMKDAKKLVETYYSKKTGSNKAVDVKMYGNYKKMLEANDDVNKKQYAKDFADDINKHINAVSEYIIDGETAPIAFMFVASEGVFRAIEKSPQDFRKKAREKNVIIVSPDTIFGPLKTFKLLIQNREMYEQSNILQKEVGLLGQDVSRLIDRFTNLGDKQEKISDDYRKLKISMDKVANRSERIKNLDLEKTPTITNNNNNK